MLKKKTATPRIDDRQENRNERKLRHLETRVSDVAGIESHHIDLTNPVELPCSHLTYVMIGKTFPWSMLLM